MLNVLPLGRNSRSAIVVMALSLASASYGEVNAQATAATAIAFGAIDKLLDRIETVDLYYGVNVTKQKSAGKHYRVPWDREYGLEFSFHVGDFDWPWGKTLSANDSAKIRALAHADSLKPLRTKADSDAVLAKVGDPGWKANSVTIKKHYAILGKDTIVTAVDSEFVATRPPVKVVKFGELDFAIGYGQVDGIETFTPYELRGYVRELPSVSLYATGWFRPKVGLYLGLRTGVISLQDAKVFVPATIPPNTTPETPPPPTPPPTVFTLSATTLQFGGAVGLFLPVGGRGSGAGLTVEVSSMLRNFNSLSTNPGKDAPSNMPHSIDLSGRSFSVGVMFPIPKAAK